VGRCGSLDEATVVPTGRRAIKTGEPGDRPAHAVRERSRAVIGRGAGGVATVVAVACTPVAILVCRFSSQAQPCGSAWQERNDAMSLHHPRARTLIVAPLVGCTLVALAAQSAHAAADAVQARDVTAAMPPLFVTAARAPQPFASLLADVTVIGADTIARSGAGSLAELLQRQPGIEITQNGGPGSTSGIFMRGTNTNQVVVLIDGLRVSSSSTGTTAIEAIPLADIDHIEILRGPASSLYGSDAIGGVVQVFTRKGGDGAHANASVGYGSFGTWNGSAGVSGGGTNWRAAIAVQGARSDGFNSIENPGNFSYDPDRDGYRGGSASANGSVDWAHGQTLSGQYFRSRMNAQFDGGDAFDDRTITTLESYGVTSVNALAPWWTSRLTAGLGSDDSVSRLGSGDFPFHTRQRQYAWQNELDLRSPLAAYDVTRAVATLGVERREERIDSADDFAVTARDTNAIFGAWQMTMGGHALQANLRHDDSTQFGSRTTGAIAWGYRFSPAWRVTASYGTAFKAPSFNDLYFPGFSNPSLVPEHSRNVEGGAYWTGSLAGAALDASLVAYRNRVDDLILFVCDADFNCAPQNLDRATITGATLSGSAAFGDTTLKASLDLASPRDDATGNLLPRRAHAHATLAALQRVGAWQLGAEVLASTHRFDDAANTVRMGGYTIVNLTAEWALAHGVTAVLRADNVLDKHYELVADYATGGAQWFAGLRWAL
jgi:vitamin B12 transporter